MQPLAYRMRPRNLNEVVGQQHLVGPGKIINRMVKAKMLSSMILYGPPGTGKTSIASAIAGSTKYAFRMLNAATDSKKDLQIVAEEAKMSGTVILLLDEIHRLDKTKQDFLLPHLENGHIILIGATTENPYLSINPAIRSRTQIFPVYPLTEKDTSLAIDRALADQERGLGKIPLELADNARQQLIRGSDVDAALHYLARLIAAGDLPSIARRLTVIAYEDIGLANPPAVQRAITAIQAAEKIGLPEARIPLADTVIELALSPKSNSGIQAIDAALERIDQGSFGEIPNWLKDAHYQGAKKLGHGVDYQYPHDFPQDWVRQQYLPDKIKNDEYYHPKPNGEFEKALGIQYRRLLKAQRHPRS